MHVVGLDSRLWYLFPLAVVNSHSIEMPRARENLKSQPFPTLDLARTFFFKMPLKHLRWQVTSKPENIPKESDSLSSPAKLRFAAISAHQEVLPSFPPIAHLLQFQTILLYFALKGQ